MKILHISECLEGGVGVYLNNIYNEKESFLDYHFFVPKSEYMYISNIIINNNHCTFFNKKNRNLYFLFSFFRFIRNNIKEINPDIIHLHSSFAGFIVRVFYLFKWNRPKIIYCSHGWSFLMDINIIKKIIFFIIEWVLSIKTDAILNISNYEHKESIRIGIPKKKSTIIKNAISPNVKKINQEPLQYQENKYNFLFVGRHNNAKGYKEIIDFFIKYNQNILHVVGDFHKLKNLKKYKNIFFYGWVHNDEIHNYYSKADIVIVPSRWEAFGLVALEAMKYSKPLIVSNRGELKEFIKENRNGYIFNFNDFENSLKEQIKKIKNKNLMIMGNESKLIFKQQSNLKNHVKEVMILYNDLMNDSCHKK